MWDVVIDNNKNMYIYVCDKQINFFILYIFQYFFFVLDNINKNVIIIYKYQIKVVFI